MTAVPTRRRRLSSVVAPTGQCKDSPTKTRVRRRAEFVCQSLSWRRVILFVWIGSILMYCGFIKIQMGDRSRYHLFQHTFPSPTKNDATKTRVKLMRNNYLRRPGIVSHTKLDGVVQFTDQLVHVVETRFMHLARSAQRNV